MSKLNETAADSLLAAWLFLSIDVDRHNSAIGIVLDTVGKFTIDKTPLGTPPVRPRICTFARLIPIRPITFLAITVCPRKGAVSRSCSGHPIAIVAIAVRVGIVAFAVVSTFDHVPFVATSRLAVFEPLQHALSVGVTIAAIPAPGDTLIRLGIGI